MELAQLLRTTATEARDMVLESGSTSVEGQQSGCQTGELEGHGLRFRIEVLFRTYQNIPVVVKYHL